MKPLLIAVALVWANAARADPGHLADVAGHNHWVAGAAIGAAIAMGVWGVLKDRRKNRTAEVATAGSDETQGA